MQEFRYEEQSFRIPIDPQGKPHVVKQHIPGRGYGLAVQGKSFAEARETVVWIRKPLVLTIETSKLQARCSQCLRIPIDDADVERADSLEECAVLKSCVGCKTVKYCGRKCQSRSWKEHHKYECKIYGALHPRVLPSPVRTVIRILKYRAHIDLEDSVWRSLLGLESHQDDLSNAGGERWQDVFLMAKAVQKYSGTKEPLDVVLRICCIITVNSFTLTDPLLEPLGMVFDPAAAMLNHSCDPNCIIRFDTDPHDPSLQSTSKSDPILGSVSVDLLRPVQDGEELTISYIDNTFPLAKRQSELASRYFFDCNCDRCSQKTQTVFNKLHTPSMSSSAADAEFNAIRVLDAATSRPSNLSQMVPIIRYALARLALTSTFPVHGYPYAPLRLQLILALIASGEWYEALLQSAILVYRIDPILYSQRHHPIRIVNRWRLFRLAHHLCVESADVVNPAAGDVDRETLKMTVVVNVITVPFERPKSTVTMPASRLDKMLLQAKAEIIRADPHARGWPGKFARSEIFDGSLKAYRLAPKREEKSLMEEWDALMDVALEKEKKYDGTVEKTTKEARKLTGKLNIFPGVAS